MEPQPSPILQHLTKAKGLRWFQKAKRAPDTSAGVGAAPQQASASKASPHPTRQLAGSLQTSCSWRPLEYCKGVRGKRGGDRSLARQSPDAVRRLAGEDADFSIFSICKQVLGRRQESNQLAKHFGFDKLENGVFLKLFWLGFSASNTASAMTLTLINTIKTVCCLASLMPA